MQKKLMFLVVAGLLGQMLVGHPHFRKAVTADMRGGKELTLKFTTYPFNEAHLSEVSKGFVFHCGRATLTTTAPASNGSSQIPAGEYAVRAEADSVDDWTFILIPVAEVGDSGDVDVSKGMRLETTTYTGQPSSHHLQLDLYSGHGDTDGKMILSLSYGGRRLEAALDVN
jgi:hypothetical protein